MVPVVAMGSISPENSGEVLETGAKNIAMVRYFMHTDAFDERIHYVKTVMKKKK
jgi:thiamine-phosphate pyrophosphorylase